MENKYIKIIKKYYNHSELFTFVGEFAPDLNITVLPSLTIPVLSNFSVICDASTPRFPVVSNFTLQPIEIIMYVGTFEVNRCVDAMQCVYTNPTFFPGTPRIISCTTLNAQRQCRFKVVNITLLQGELIGLFNSLDINMKIQQK